MPKIPTFEAQQRPTTQVISPTSQFQVSPEKVGSQFGALAGVLDAATSTEFAGVLFVINLSNNPISI